MPCGCCNQPASSPLSDTLSDDYSMQPQPTGICVKCFTFWLIVAILALLALSNRKEE